MCIALFLFSKFLAHKSRLTEFSVADTSHVLWAAMIRQAGLVCGMTQFSIHMQEDKQDGAAIEAILADMQSAEDAPIVKHLVNELFTRRQAAA